MVVLMFIFVCCCCHCVCRWGYTELSDLEAVRANYSNAGLPLEALWVDIELMNNRFQVFTFDKGKQA